MLLKLKHISCRQTFQLYKYYLCLSSRYFEINLLGRGRLKNEGLCKGSVVPENCRKTFQGHAFSCILSMSAARFFCNSQLIWIQFLVRHRPVYKGGLKNKTTQFFVNRISVVSLHETAIKANMYLLM
jgi:hypothetical protein